MAFSLNCNKFLRLYPGIRYFPRYCSTSDKKGIVLGAYTDESGNGIELTSASEKFNERCQGKLSKQIELSIFN